MSNADQNVPPPGDAKTRTCAECGAPKGPFSRSFVDPDHWLCFPACERVKTPRSEAFRDAREIAERWLNGSLHDTARATAEAICRQLQWAEDEAMRARPRPETAMVPDPRELVALLRKEREDLKERATREQIAKGWENPFCQTWSAQAFAWGQAADLVEKWLRAPAEPARTAENEALAQAYDKGKQASKEAVEKWEKMYRFASVQLAAIGDIVGNVNGDPEVTPGIVRALVAAARAPNAATPPIGVTSAGDEQLAERWLADHGVLDLTTDEEREGEIESLTRVLAAVRAEEREACALECSEEARRLIAMKNFEYLVAERCANAIQRRGEGSSTATSSPTTSSSEDVAPACDADEEHAAKWIDDMGDAAVIGHYREPEAVQHLAKLLAAVRNEERAAYGELYECAACSAKSGAPTLCEDCLRRRKEAGKRWRGQRPRRPRSAEEKRALDAALDENEERTTNDDHNDAAHERLNAEAGYGAVSDLDVVVVRQPFVPNVELMRRSLGMTTPAGDPVGNQEEVDHGAAVPKGPQLGETQEAGSAARELLNNQESAPTTAEIARGALDECTSEQNAQADSSVTGETDSSPDDRRVLRGSRSSAGRPESASAVPSLRPTALTAAENWAMVEEKYRGVPRPPEALVRHAAVGLVTRDDGRFLCVWNRRYGGWAFPGGMVEDGETIHEGLCREVAEETSLKVRTAEVVFEGEHGLRPKNNERDGRASVVHIFRVTTTGEPRETEPGCPITWLTREEFLAQSPFREFYAAKVFVDAPSAATEALDPIDPLELDPGIRGVVAWLRSLGFDTSDSGDGVTKTELIADGDALDVPHVHIAVEPAKLLAEASRLLQALVERGLISDPGTIQASYDPADGIATLSLMGINDEMLAAAGLEAQADAFIKSVADGMAATVQKTWRKAVAAAADADRRKVAEALVHRLDHESDTPSERLTALLAETRREERDRLLFGQGWAVTRKVGEDPPFNGPREYLVDVTKRNSDDVWKWSTNADDAWRLGYRRAELYAQCAFDVADTEWLGEKTGGTDV